MKKIILILLSIISIASFSQTSFQCTKTIDTSNCRLRFFNANSVKIFELNLATTTYTRGVTNEYIIKDGLTQVTITNNGCLTTPTFANLASFIDGARLACSSSGSSAVTFPTNLDTSQVDTSLINYLVQFDTSINRLDSILASIKRQSSVDTTHESILQHIEENTKSDCIGSNETYYINGTNTISINASEVCSYSISVIEDEITFTENSISAPYNLPTGYSASTSFKNGSKYLVNQISFTGVNAKSKAIIKVIK